MKYRVLIEQDEDGVFVAEVPSLPGCISQGQTREEATQNIKEAIELYLHLLTRLCENAWLERIFRYAERSY